MVDTTCLRCGYKWWRRCEKPKQCQRCKSPDYDKPYIRQSRKNRFWPKDKVLPPKPLKHSKTRAAWKERMGLTEKQAAMLSEETMRKLSHCRSDEARRLILGVSK